MKEEQRLLRLAALASLFGLAGFNTFLQDFGPLLPTCVFFVVARPVRGGLHGFFRLFPTTLGKYVEQLGRRDGLVGNEENRFQIMYYFEPSF